MTKRIFRSICLAVMAVLAASLLLDLSPVLYVLAAGVAGAVIGAVRRRNAK